MPRYIIEQETKIIQDWIPRCSVYEVIAGSRSQGLSGDNSDFDIRGVFIPPFSHIVSPFLEMEQVSIDPKRFQLWTKNRPGVSVEGSLWSIFKFVSLAVDGSPQVLEVLFVDSRYVLRCHPVFEEFLSQRDLFLSESLRDNFLGYAKKTLRKIRRHKQWITNPLKEQPTRESFGILGLKIPKDKIQECRRLEDTSVLPKEVQEFLDREKKYQEAKHQWDAYKIWLLNRNTDKVVSGNLFGYDPKDALNIVRYLRMAGEILEGRGFIVDRQGEIDLLEIKQGKWEYDKLISYIESEIQRIETIIPTINLRQRPDVESISSLLIRIVQKFIKIRGEL
jgi:uncharacterized protein